MQVEEIVEAALKKNDTKSLDLLSAWILKEKIQDTNKILSSQEIEQIAQACDLAYSEDEKNSNALYLRGILFKMGLGYIDIPHPDLAKKCLEEAVILGNTAAMWQLARMLPKTDQRKIELLVPLSDSNNPEALYELSTLYYSNTDKKDIKKAISCLEGAIKLGHVDANYALAQIYLDKDSGHFNTQAAIEYLESAISKGHTDAMITRAVMHINRQGEPNKSLVGMILLREAHRLEKKKKDSRAVTLARGLINSVRTDIAYHASLILNNIGDTKSIENFINIYPNDFIKYLRKDKFFSEVEKIFFVESLLKKHPIANTFKVDTQYRNLVSQCYLDAAEELTKLGEFDQALELYNKVPEYMLNENEVCPAKGIACLAIFSILYNRAIKEGNSQFCAFELASPYLLHGITIKSKDCQETYIKFTNLILNKENIAPNSWEELKKQYDQYRSSLPPEKTKLEIFITRHHLKNLKFWQEHLNSNEYTEVSCDKKDYKIPPLVAEFMQIIEDQQKTTKEKLVEIAQTSKSKYNMMFSFLNTLSKKESKEAVACYEDAKVLVL